MALEAGFQWEWNPKMEERLWRGHRQGELGLPTWQVGSLKGTGRGPQDANGPRKLINHFPRITFLGELLLIVDMTNLNQRIQLA